MTRRSPVAFLVGLAWISCGPSADDWSQWRGPGGTAVSPATRLPVAWSTESDNVRWKVPLRGKGNSAPIVFGDRIFVTTSYPVDSSDGRPDATERPDLHRVVLALSATDGEIVWQTPVYAAPVGKKHKLNTAAAATPATDGEGVFAYFGAKLARLSFDGRIEWSVDVDPDYAKFARYGAASSPILTPRHVIVVQDKEYANNGDVGWIAAFDKETGEEAWRTEWEHTCCSYSTPLLVDRGAGLELYYAHSAEIASYAAATGEKLWSHPYPMLQMVSTPVLDRDLLGISGGADHKRGTVFLRLSGAGADTTVEPLWQQERYSPQAGSPVLYRGTVFSATEHGVLAAWDAQTGELVSRQRLSRGQIRATLVAGDGKVYATSFGGVVSVVSADPPFEILAENDLGERGSTASPAIGAGCFLYRTPQHLFCIEAASEL